MSHSEVYKWFELYFPQYAGDKVESWFQNGNWRFETVESFMNGLKGGKK